MMRNTTDLLSFHVCWRTCMPNRTKNSALWDPVSGPLHRSYRHLQRLPTSEYFHILPPFPPPNQSLSSRCGSTQATCIFRAIQRIQTRAVGGRCASPPVPIAACERFGLRELPRVREPS
jgi:hypothetical protein